MTALQFLLVGGGGHRTEGRGDLRLVEQQTDLADLVFVVGTVGQFVSGGVEAADDLVLRGLAAHLVVTDAETNHVDTHVCR